MDWSKPGAEGGANSPKAEVVSGGAGVRRRTGVRAAVRRSEMEVSGVSAPVVTVFVSSSLNTFCTERRYSRSLTIAELKVWPWGRVRARWWRGFPAWGRGRRGCALCPGLGTGCGPRGVLERRWNLASTGASRRNRGEAERAGPQSCAPGCPEPGVQPQGRGCSPWRAFPSPGLLPAV